MEEKNLNYNYKVEIQKLSEEDGGGFFATVPRLPGCMSDGESYEEIFKNINDAIKCWIDTAKELGRKIPEPESCEADEYSGKLSLRIAKSLHKSISTKAEQEGISINQLIQNYISMGLGYDWGSKHIMINVEYEKEKINNNLNNNQKAIWENVDFNKGQVNPAELVNLIKGRL